MALSNDKPFGSTSKILQASSNVIPLSLTLEPPAAAAAAPAAGFVVAVAAAWRYASVKALPKTLAPVNTTWTNNLWA